MNVRKYLELAAQVSRIKEDSRTYYHGAVGIRRDGVLVCASNGCPKEPEPQAHAEARILRKLGKGGIVFVVRTLSDGTWGDSTPCIHCQKLLDAKELVAVYYSTFPYFRRNSWEAKIY